MINHFDPIQYQAKPDLLKDKIIVVTGAGDGIGRTAALTFAAHGATVILLGRTIAKLEKVYDEITKNNFPQPAIYPINFVGAKEEDYNALAISIDKEFGRLDGILHNASELGPRSALTQYPADVWQQILQVNLTAPFLLSKALIPILEKAQHGSMIFTGSGVGFEGRAYWGAYAVSKAGTENLMQIFANELSEISNIRVNSINPGATRTKMRASAYPAEDPRALKTPEDHMPVYLYLMGDDSIGVNKQQFSAQLKK